MSRLGGLATAMASQRRKAANAHSTIKGSHHISTTNSHCLKGLGQVQRGQCSQTSQNAPAKKLVTWVSLNFCALFPPRASGVSEAPGSTKNYRSMRRKHNSELSICLVWSQARWNLSQQTSVLHQWRKLQHGEPFDLPFEFSLESLPSLRPYRLCCMVDNFHHV